EWKVLPAQVAKTLTLRVGEDAISVVTCGDSRLDNRKRKEELGGKGHLMPGSEASKITRAKAFRGGRDRRGLDPRSYPNPAHSICPAPPAYRGRCAPRI